MQKSATTQAPIQEQIAKRWSPRVFAEDKYVSKAQIVSMLEAARWAPSCFGEEPWRFVVCDKAINPAAWQLALDCIVPGNQTWAKNAPLFILVCASTLFTHNDKPNRFAEYDTGAAVMSLCLQATDMGLFSHQMGGYDTDKAKTVFNIPDDIQPMAMVALGHYGEVDSLDEELKTREQAERKRKALGELFFDGTWGQPVS